MVFAAAVTFGAATGSASWEYGEPQNEAPALASLSSQSGMGIGGTLEPFPSVLFPTYPENGQYTGSGARSGLLDARLSYGNPEAFESGGDAGSNPAPTPGRPNLPTDYPGLTLPTHVDHDGATVAAAGTRVRALGGVLSEAEMRAVLTVAGWPSSEISNALRVSFCESRWSAYATNGVDNGLFGMSSASNATTRGGWLTYWGFQEEQTFDPVVNATAALWTWQRSGWGPWSCKP